MLKYSQESARTTSTPQGSVSENIPSPSVSSICSSRDNFQITSPSISSVHEFQSRSPSRDLENISNAEESSHRTSLDYGTSMEWESATARSEETMDREMELPVQIKKIKHPDWKLYEPEDNLSLYYKIYNAECCLQVLADQISGLYKACASETLGYIITYFISLAGYQTFKINNYNPHIISDLKIIKKLERELPPALHDGKYLFNLSHESFKEIVDRYKQFVYELIIVMYKKRTFDKLLCDRIIGFLLAMSNCSVRSLVTVGTTLATMVMKAFVEIIHNDCDNNWHTQVLSIIESKPMKSLREIFLRNCVIDDPKLYSLKAQCARHFFDLLMLAPKTFFSPLFFNKFVTYFTDEHSIVRIVALETAIKIVDKIPSKFWKNSNMLCVIEENYLLLMSDTFIQYLITLETNYPESVSRIIVTDLSSKIYCNNAEIASSCADYFYQTLNEKITKQEFLEAIIKFNQSKPKLTPLLVEAFIDVCPDLQQFDALLTFLIKSKMNMTDKENLLLIICEAIKQTINGKSEMARLHSKRNHIRIKNELKQITDIIFHHSKDIFSIFSESNCVDAFVNTFKYLYYEMITNTDALCDGLDVLLEVIFKNHEKKKILLAISDLVCFLLENVKNQRIKSGINQFLNEHTKYFSQILQVTGNEELFDEEKLGLYLKQISCLLQFNNLKNIDLTSAYTLLTSCPILTFKMRKHILNCNVFILLYILGQYVKEEASEEVILSLKEIFDNINTFIFDCIESCSDDSLVIAAFESLCCLHLQTNLLVDEDQYHIVPRVTSDVKSIILEKQDILAKFLNKYVFLPKDQEDGHLKRMKLLHSYMLMILKNVWILSMVNIFSQFYNCFDEYGDIIRSALISIHACNKEVLITFIWNTILTVFEKIYIPTNEIPQEKHNEFRNLIKQFVVSLPTVDFKPLIEHIITYVTAERDMTMLQYSVFFCNKLSVQQRKELLKFMKENNLQSEFDKNTHVQALIQILKVPRVRRTPVAKPFASSPSREESSRPTEESSSAYAIEEVSD